MYGYKSEFQNKTKKDYTSLTCILFALSITRSL